MINLIGAQLITLPPGAKSGASSQLPWPNGSILSARMVPGEPAGHVILMLGSYRFQAKVPANTPMGNIWMQLVNREMPAQFRLLSDFKAASLVAEMLSGKTKPQDQPVDANRGGRFSQESGWQKVDQSQLPFQAETDTQRMMLHDDKDGSTRGVVNASSDEHGFLLHGRTDLDHLGPVAFALEGADDQRWILKLYAGRDSNIAELRPAFIKWLQEPEGLELHSRIDGRILGGLPERFEAIGNLRA